MKLFIFLLITILIFGKSLFFYFVQDDFWLLYVSQVKTISDFFSLFIPNSQVVWYRPISSHFFFFLGRLFFGLKPFAYHVIVFLTFVLIMYSLYVLVKKITLNKEVALISSIIYGSHQINTISLSWLSVYSFVLGPLLLLFTIYYYIDRKYLKAVVFYILGLLSNEIILISPIIILSHQIINKRKINLTQLIPYIIFAIFFILIRYVIYPYDIKIDLYQAEFSIKIFDLFKFYLLRIIGVPLLFDAISFKIKVELLLLISIFYLFILNGVISSLTFKKNVKSNYFFFSIFISGLIPLVLFPSHISPHYLSFSLIGFAPILAYYFKLSADRILIRGSGYIITLFLCIFIFIQYIGIQWTYQTHWIFRRAELAKKLVENGNLIHQVGSEEYFSLGANEAQNVFK